ncbi:MAG TPA: HEAT repeat domain-containing protein, partial [Acidobacteriota bacterium]|nr:HEAT repeat domain-containing protein [Acidobacteriota bacterium]
MLKDLFNKPKWQHRDPSVRREVIGELSDQELQQALPEVLKDPDAEVRVAALKRALSLQELQRVAAEDPEEGVRQTAGQRLRELLRQPSQDSHSLQERIEFLRNSQDQSLLEDLLHTAPHADLRRALLNLSPREKALADVAVDDTDAEMRRLALKKLEDESLLERVMRDTRRHDKRIYREARAKLQQKRLEQGDPRAVRRRRQELCSEAEKLAWTVDADRDAKSLDEIVEEWKNLPVAPEEEMQRRFDAICHRGLNKGKEASAAEEEDRDKAGTSATAQAAAQEESKDATPPRESGDADSQQAAAARKSASAQGLIERAERLARDKKSGLQQRLLSRLRESWKEAGRQQEISEEDRQRFSQALEQLEELLREQSKRNQEILEEIRGHLGEVERHLAQG